MLGCRSSGLRPIPSAGGWASILKGVSSDLLSSGRCKRRPAHLSQYVVGAVQEFLKALPYPSAGQKVVQAEPVYYQDDAFSLAVILLILPRQQGAAEPSQLLRCELLTGIDFPCEHRSLLLPQPGRSFRQSHCFPSFSHRLQCGHHLAYASRLKPHVSHFTSSPFGWQTK